MIINCLVEGKIPVKALIDTGSKSNTISKSLFDKLEEDYGIRDFDENLYGGVVAVPVENLYRDVIGEIKCLDLQFHYKGKWRSLDGIEVIDFQIRKNPSFDLVLGRDWLWMYKAKICFGFSSEINDSYAKIIIDGMSIPLIKEDNKQRKRYHGRHEVSCSADKPPVPPTPRRLDDDFGKEIKKATRNLKKTIHTLHRSGQEYNLTSDSDTTSDSNTSDSDTSAIEDMHRTEACFAKKKRPILKRKVKSKVSRSEDAIAPDYRAL